jgi:DNA-binding MarR family transcriptional regulator
LREVDLLNRQPNIEIKRLINAFESLSRAQRKKQPLLGLKQSEIRVLLCIKDISYNANCISSISEISKRMFVTSPTVTELIKSLSSKGYIERCTDSKDKRVVDIKLTDKGEKIVEKGIYYFVTLFTGLVDKLGEEKSEILLEILEQVCEYLDEVHVQGWLY